MKRLILLFVLLCNLTTVYSQNNLTINGKLLFPAEKEVFFENVSVFLKLNDTIFLTTKTNAKGEFKFQFKRINEEVLICHESLNRLKGGTVKHCGYLSCNGMPASTSTIINLNADTVYNLQLEYPWEITNYCYFSCYYHPKIYFKTNSALPQRDKDLVMFTHVSSDSIISVVKKIIEQDPKMKVEIIGHCDNNEGDIKNLSLKRANFIKEQLVKNGISASKISVKGIGISQPVIDIAIINLEKDQTKKEELMQKNRRVSFKFS